MAIVNRDKGTSEQIHHFSAVLNTSTGASAASNFFIAQMPFPATLTNVAVAANSISGAPQVSISVARWTAGGQTLIPYVGSTLAVLAYGASAAYQTVTLATAGSTLLNLQTGDIVVLKQEFAGGNTAMGNAAVTVCVQAAQDIVQFFGVVTGS